MATSMQPIRDRARAHQADLELAVSYFTVQKLAERWNISESTVRDIARDRLPYKEFGKGRKLKRRRYHPDDVFAFEAADRKTEREQ